MTALACQDRESLRLTAADAWLNRQDEKQREYQKKLVDHEATCPVCAAVKSGVGLAGGLFRGAVIIEYVAKG